MRTIVNIALGVLAFFGIVNAIRYPIYQQVLDSWFDTNGEGITKIIKAMTVVVAMMLAAVLIAEGIAAFLGWYLK